MTESEKKELLELAAKAAGITDVWWSEEGYGWPDPSNAWNPLKDDGDALRLAVKLNLFLDIMDDRTQACAAPYDDETDAIQMHNNDPYAATRLAIVRAAAAIGRSMK